MTDATPGPTGDGMPDSRLERRSLADLLLRLGPDQPTLCQGWTTRDLAAHLVMRERRPDAAIGIAVGPLRGWSERVRTRIARTEYPDLVAKVRAATPWTVGPLDRAMNTMEFFVHHEDVRRAQPDWAPRELSGRLKATLWQRVRGIAKLALRTFPASVAVISPGYGEITAGRGGAQMRVTGDPGELALFFLGRQRAANVEVEGPADLSDSLRRAKFGI